MAADFEQPKDPIEEYDRANGAPKMQPMPGEAEAWGTKLNPVRETPLAGTNLQSVGK